MVFGDAAVPAPLPIYADRDATELRHLARRERDGRVSARLLALANALDGLPRKEVARLAGMTGQTLGDWVHRYHEAGMEDLRDRPRPGRPCALDGAAGRPQGAGAEGAEPRARRLYAPPSGSPTASPTRSASTSRPAPRSVLAPARTGSR